jgi:hypothetical protein
MYTGRNEFGEEHKQFVTYAFIAFVVGIVIMVVGFMLMVAGALSGITVDPTVEDPDINYSQLVEGMTAGLIVVQFGGLVILIGEILLVFKLENELGKNILYLTLIAGIIITIITTVLFTSALNDFMDTLNTTPDDEVETEVENFQNRVNGFGLLGLITTVLLIIAYYIPFDRIKKGELKPLVPTPFPYGTPMYPPQYPYQQYPTQGPGQQPPGYPPQYPPQEQGQQPPGEPGSQPAPPPLDPNAPVGPPPESTSELKMAPVETVICPHCGANRPKGPEKCISCGK